MNNKVRNSELYSHINIDNKINDNEFYVKKGGKNISIDNILSNLSLNKVDKNRIKSDIKYYELGKGRLTQPTHCPKEKIATLNKNMQGTFSKAIGRNSFMVVGICDHIIKNKEDPRDGEICGTRKNNIIGRSLVPKDLLDKAIK